MSEPYDLRTWAEAIRAMPHLDAAETLLRGYIDRAASDAIDLAVAALYRDGPTEPLEAPLTPVQPPADHGDGSGAGGREGGEGA